MTLMILQGQRSVSGNIRETQTDQEREEGKDKLTNFTRLRLDFVSDNPVKTEGNHSTLTFNDPCCHAQHIRSSSLPVDGADAGHAVMVTHLLQQQPVSDLPGEYVGVGVFQVQDHLHNSGSGHFGLRASNQSWSDASCLIVPEFTILISLRKDNILPEVKVL